MVIILLVVVLFAAFSAVGYVLLLRAGLVPGPGGVYREPGALRVPRLPELPQGCLVALLLAALVWFVLWSFVLVLALRFLRSPLG